MSKLKTGLVLIALTLAPSTTYAAQTVKVDCWKRLSDGDVHADVSKYPAFGSGFKVITFKPNHKDAEWNYGSCVLAPRR